MSKNDTIEIMCEEKIDLNHAMRSKHRNKMCNLYRATIITGLAMTVLAVVCGFLWISGDALRTVYASIIEALCIGVAFCTGVIVDAIFRERDC